MLNNSILQQLDTCSNNYYVAYPVTLAICWMLLSKKCNRITQVETIMQCASCMVPTRLSPLPFIHVFCTTRKGSTLPCVRYKNYFINSCMALFLLMHINSHSLPVSKQESVVWSPCQVIATSHNCEPLPETETKPVTKPLDSLRRG